MANATFFFITLGCAKNEVDTDKMRTRLLDAGLVEAASIEDASVVLINTCSFLASATSESIEATLSVVSAQEDLDAHAPIIMCGCVPSRYGDELDDELPEVSAFVSVEDEEDIVRIVCEVLGIELGANPAADAALRTIEGASAYVKISDGCDRFCTFCAIPFIRGRYASRTQADICREVRELMEGGVREIVLIGQDTGVWGRDLPGSLDLAWLLDEVARIVRPWGGWVRVLYLQPEGMTDRLIAALRDIPEVLPYIDIPIQHCCAPILRRMGRTGDSKELATLFSRLREEIPGMVLRTTGLVGFPGETERDFQELLEFVERQEFDYTSVFAYSAEEGTRAALMDGQVDEQAKLERAQRLIDVTEQLGFSATAAHVGETVDVIIDGIEQTEDGTELVGHAWFQAPDCDGAVHIEEGEASVGDVVRCKLVDSFCYELVGVPVGEASGDGVDS
ncbi:MAG: 30S ribosomal protein S12 methylthiotransferase RimO [Coriobacteriales bacterium]|nr:30S ribosomal protein S12 methylthiotransferase RimO [Coriobacteriales bacterium]